MKHKVVIVDDHVLFTRALEEMVNQFSGYEVLFSADNGKDFIDKLSDSNVDPDVVLLDLNMPIMDGFETLKWIKEHKKNVKTLALSMNDNEKSIIKAIRKGANGYLVKNITPKELNFAITHLMDYGFYHNDLVSKALLKNMNKDEDEVFFKLKDRELTFFCTCQFQKSQFSILEFKKHFIFKDEDEVFFKLKDRELTFLKLACTEMTFKEIANEMCLCPKTIDGYRQALFEKLNIRSRVGLVLYAIQNNIID